MKIVGTINILALLLLALLLPLTGCEKDEPDEFTIVGTWRNSRDGWWPPKYTFPPNGIIKNEEENNGVLLKYRLTENKDTLRIIEMTSSYINEIDAQGYAFYIYDRKIHFLTNDSIRIEDDNYDPFLGTIREGMTLVRIKE